MPPAVDMSPIMEALARRGTGAPVPAGQQVSLPTRVTPTGNPGNPIQPMPQSPMSDPGNMPRQVAPSNPATDGALKAGQMAQGPKFDDQTRELAKSLVARLLKGM